MVPQLKLLQNKVFSYGYVFLLSTLFFYLSSHNSIRWLNSDAFYYYVIGWNSYDFHLSYDSSNPTTGIHPLWQILILILNLFLEKSSNVYLAIVLGLCATFLIMALINLVSIMQIYSKFSWFLVFFPSYWITFGILSDNQYGNIFSYINGMESSLSIYLLVLMVKILLSDSNLQTNRISIQFGLISFLTVFSRLDLIPVVFSLTLLLFYKSLIRFRVLLCQLLYPLLALVLFLCYSKIIGGSFLPSSWITKLGTSANLDWNWTNFKEILFSTSIIEYRDVLLSRHFQALVPVCFFVVFIIFRLFAKNVSTRSQLKIGWTEIVFFLGLGISSRSLVLYRQENIWNQGNWYFFDGVFFSQLLINLLIVVIFQRFFTQRVYFFLLILVFSLNSLFVYNRLVSDFNQKYIDFWNNRDRICTSLELFSKQKCETVKFAEFDDGVLSYALGGNNFNALGLAVDTKAAWEIKDGNLLNLLDSRCYKYYASVNYQELNAGILTKYTRAGDRILNFNGLWILVRNPMGLPVNCVG